MMYDRLRDLLIGEQGNPLQTRNEIATEVIRKNPGTAMGPGGRKPHTSPYKVATARMRLANLLAPQPAESNPPGANTLPKPVPKRTAAQDAETAKAKRASSAAAVRTGRG